MSPVKGDGLISGPVRERFTFPLNFATIRQSQESAITERHNHGKGPHAMKIYLARHGETRLNKAHLMQGRSDEPLKIGRAHV